eukprot:CAMPEP_0168364660 /NCGR_PEP_ID=MMETSP0228-20121227/4321_1 /TAXON_ID=133427 /ORGANISM="Protoceratium reticulatum, Strain CCCM 535 (=CCMP 1889)" /LENGTH=187 /DNA_ID=CAMNT_0008377425 /DNA_START=110 /DNA_END=670 /DNA_ORIENTATION=+
MGVHTAPNVPGIGLKVSLSGAGRPAETECGPVGAPRAPLERPAQLVAPSTGLSGAADATGRLGERPMHGQFLLQQHLAIHTLVSGLSLLLRLILDECITLDESCSAVQIEVQVLDVAKLCECLEDVVLLSLLVHAGDDDDPSFDGARRAGIVLVVGEALEHAGLARVAVVLLRAAALDPPAAGLGAL